jgi:hypothetical protein
MKRDFAGHDAQKCGQRFLSSSAPRLKRHAVPCETAGGHSGTLPAGKDQKLLREFEGGALISAEGAVALLSLP